MSINLSKYSSERSQERKLILTIVLLFFNTSHKRLKSSLVIILYDKSSSVKDSSLITIRSMNFIIYYEKRQTKMKVRFI